MVERDLRARLERFQVHGDEPALRGADPQSTRDRPGAGGRPGDLRRGDLFERLAVEPGDADRVVEHDVDRPSGGADDVAGPELRPLGDGLGLGVDAVEPRVVLARDEQCAGLVVDREHPHADLVADQYLGPQHAWPGRDGLAVLVARRQHRRRQGDEARPRPPPRSSDAGPPDERPGSARGAPNRTTGGAPAPPGPTP